jgi:predicted phosphodiesterase
MKLAVLADLHANYPALNAVLDDLPAGVDTVVYLGDFIGVMGFPQETVAAVREHADYAVKGNHDVAVLERNEGHVNSRSLSEFELEHTKANLTDEQADWITGLQAYAELPERGLLLAHAQPRPEAAVGITPGNLGVNKGEFPRVAAAVDSKTYEYILLGHTHEQAVLDCSRFGHDVTVLNPGSVGQPMGEAEYALIETQHETVECRTVEYDASPIKTRLRDLGVPVTWW